MKEECMNPEHSGYNCIKLHQKCYECGKENPKRPNRILKYCSRECAIKAVRRRHHAMFAKQ